MDRCWTKTAQPLDLRLVGVRKDDLLPGTTWGSEAIISSVLFSKSKELWDSELPSTSSANVDARSREELTLIRLLIRILLARPERQDSESSCSVSMAIIP